jgi:hypothetical protein
VVASAVGVQFGRLILIIEIAKQVTVIEIVTLPGYNGSR